jgi:hypothetical protein
VTEWRIPHSHPNVKKSCKNFTHIFINWGEFCRCLFHAVGQTRWHAVSGVTRYKCPRRPKSVCHTKQYLSSPVNCCCLSPAQPFLVSSPVGTHDLLYVNSTWCKQDSNKPLVSVADVAVVLHGSWNNKYWFILHRDETACKCLVGFLEST